MRKSEDLAAEIEQVSAQLADAGREAAMATAEGRDARAVSAKRLKLKARNEELIAALEIARRYEAERLDAERGEEAVAARKAARGGLTNMVEAAAYVDAALVALEDAFAAFDVARLEAERLLIAAGEGDGGRFRRTVFGYAMRWAVYHSAPKVAEAAQVARTSMVKRRSLADAVRGAVPNV